MMQREKEREKDIERERDREKEKERVHKLLQKRDGTCGWTERGSRRRRKKSDERGG